MKEIGTETIVKARMNKLILMNLRILMNLSRAFESSADDIALMRTTSSRALQLCDAPMIWIPHSTTKRAENSMINASWNIMME